MPSGIFHVMLLLGGGGGSRQQQKILNTPLETEMLTVADAQTDLVHGRNVPVLT